MEQYTRTKDRPTIPEETLLETAGLRASQALGAHTALAGRAVAVRHALGQACADGAGDLLLSGTDNMEPKRRVPSKKDRNLQ